jgi:hypothetical protein
VLIVGARLAAQLSIAVLFFLVLGIEPRALHVLGKCCAAELYTHTHIFIYLFIYFLETGSHCVYVYSPGWQAGLEFTILLCAGITVVNHHTWS